MAGREDIFLGQDRTWRYWNVSMKLRTGLNRIFYSLFYFLFFSVVRERQGIDSATESKQKDRAHWSIDTCTEQICSNNMWISFWAQVEGKPSLNSSLFAKAQQKRAGSKERPYSHLAQTHRERERLRSARERGVGLSVISGTFSANFSSFWSLKVQSLFPTFLYSRSPNIHSGLLRPK